MNYETIYKTIINRAVLRSTVEESFDKHHILPRSLGGSNCKSNMVKLTLREHFVCHLLLAKIHGGGMLHAALMLSSFKRYHSRQYKWVRERYIAECMQGDNNPARRFPCTDQKRQKNSETSKGRKWLNDGTDSRMAKGEQIDVLISQGWVLGRLMTDTLKEGIRKGGSLTGGYNKGIPMTENAKKHLSELNTGKPSPTKGRVCSAEEVEQMRVRKLGTTHSPETKHKMSLSATGIHAGKKYINKDGITRHTHPNDLQSFLDNGWTLGKIKQLKENHNE